MKSGDLVVRKSYGGDITFRIEGIYNDMSLLKGVDYRLIADAPLEDLVSASDTTVRRRTRQAQIKMIQSVEALELDRRRQKEKRPMEDVFQGTQNGSVNPQVSYFEVPGKVLHLDGDPNYLQKSMALYRQLRVPAEGHYIQESSMAEAVYRLLPQTRPDIVVITGHDGVLKHIKHRDLYSLQSYKNSQNFVNAVKNARQYEKHLDMLTVIAGACQSHFEALIGAGANFASSPGRIMIHALDPVYVAAKASYTSIRDTVNIADIAPHTMTGTEGLGGVETRGSFRVGMPKWKDLSTLQVTPSIV
ncbi:MAG: sporulation peptidase YabG [Paenibacillus sp.]|uniref:Spore coat assemly protein n=1 Tax=Paenibacillus aquistagni TaxID=1852522 RepID=A0A1X7M015_9BACL|nr:sporulation peptidase YabG [Paenibacillus aquistagni]MBR2567997.1 sporulation peptidase YabG [Paenibacillus sp.]NMM55264.1 sporulation peptidase YabG [Paenibacillus aquistagni]SMG58873.1 spore coat assemly protein [Paenibacillus aquistagni]